MLLLGWVFVAVCSSFAATSHVSCPFQSRRVLSYDYQLLSRGNLTASSADLTSPAHYLFSRSNAPERVWCTAPDAGTSHHINLSFSQSVVVEHVISAGFSNGYVTNFSIEYSQDWEGEFTVYHSPHIQQYFLVPHIDVVFALDQPLVAHWLRLLVHDGLMAPSARLCWHLTFLGCLLTDLTAPGNEPPPSHTVATTHPPQPSPLPSLSPADSHCHSLALVLGSVAAATVLVVLLAVVVAVLVHAWCLRHSNTRWRSHRTIPPGNTIVGIQRDLYDNPQSLTGSARCGPDASPYEVPLASPGGGRESLMDNPMYSLPYEHLRHCSRARARMVLRIPLVHNESYRVAGAGGSVGPGSGSSLGPRPHTVCVELAETSAVYDIVH